MKIINVTNGNNICGVININSGVMRNGGCQWLSYLISLSSSSQYYNGAQLNNEIIIMAAIISAIVNNG